MAVPDPVQILGYAGVLLPQLCEGNEEFDRVDPLEAAAGLGQLIKNLDRCHPDEEGGLVLERADPSRVNKLEEVVVGAALDGALARLVPCACCPVLFLGTASGVVGLEIGVGVRVRRDLAVVWRTRRDGDLVAGVLENGDGGVAGVGAFECDLKADVEEVLLEVEDMVVVGIAQDFCSIFARLCK